MDGHKPRPGHKYLLSLHLYVPTSTIHTSTSWGFAFGLVPEAFSAYPPKPPSRYQVLVHSVALPPFPSLKREGKPPLLPSFRMTYSGICVRPYFHLVSPKTWTFLSPSHFPYSLISLFPARQLPLDSPSNYRPVASHSAEPKTLEFLFPSKSKDKRRRAVKTYQFSLTPGSSRCRSRAQLPGIFLFKKYY